MASLFEAYITNLGKYNEGELVGETLKFPTTTEEVQGLLKRIGVDGVRYEEFFITSFDGDVLGLYDYLTNMKTWTSSTIWPACSPSWIRATWRNLRRSLTAANILPAWPISSTSHKIWIALNFIPILKMMKFRPHYYDRTCRSRRSC